MLEAGAQSFGIHWERIQDEVAKFTRVCSYDRAGFGWSEPVHEELAPQQVAEMLHALLENGGEGPPYLMAGHSLGGVFVRTFTAEYPDEVVGMVLVDSTHDNQNQQLPPVLEKIGDMQLEAFRINLGLCQTLAPVGLMRALKMMDAGVSSLVPEDEKEPVLAQMYRTGLCGAMMREANMMVAHFSQPRTLEGLGDIPLIVLSAERDAQEMYDGYENYPADILSQLSVEMMQGQVDAFYKLQDELAALSTRGERIVVEGSGHNIQLDQPEVVIDAIRGVFEQVPK